MGRLQAVVIGALAVLAGGVMTASCVTSSGTGNAPTFCTARGKCANERSPTSAETADCAAAASDATCGAKFKTYMTCVYANERCNSDGTPDINGTILTSCLAEFAAYTSCTTPDGGTESGVDGGGTACTMTCPSGCCQNGVCLAGTTNAACGTGGAQCTTCGANRICRADRTCGVDPDGLWKVQPVSATISSTNQGADWDAVGGLPDPFVDLWCPSNAALATGRTPTAADTLSPTWASGGCTMKAKDLLSLGFALDVWDEDVSSNDPIAGKGTIAVTESDLLLGSMTGITNKVTLLNLKVAFQKQ